LIFRNGLLALLVKPTNKLKPVPDNGDGGEEQEEFL
jgi:hypothetical protein